MFWPMSNPDLIPFKTFLSENEAVIKTYMKWDNYGLNETEFIIKETFIDDTLDLLGRHYANVKVDTDCILDQFLADMGVYFPQLVQLSSITRVFSYDKVPERDMVTEHETSTQQRDETLDSNQNATIKQSGQTTDNIDQTTTTSQLTNATGDSTSETVSGVEETGGRSVAFQQIMPEQALPDTGNFPVDEQGTPILNAARVQSASTGFNTQNPLNSKDNVTQTSIQETTNDTNTDQKGTNTQDTTNDSTSEAIGKDVSSGTITGAIERSTERTNPLFAQELTKFMQNVNTINAFEWFLGKFYWLQGVI